MNKTLVIIILLALVSCGAPKPPVVDGTNRKPINYCGDGYQSTVQVHPSTLQP